MKLSEYIAEIEKPLVVGADRKHNVSDLHDHFKAGHFTPAQVLDFYKQRDTSAFIALAQQFQKGKLFSAQSQGWESWTHGDYAVQDKGIAENYLSIEQSAQQKDLAIRSFIFCRVYGSRKNDGDEKHRQRWIDDNQRNNWRWNS